MFVSYIYKYVCVKYIVSKDLDDGALCIIQRLVLQPWLISQAIISIRSTEKKKIHQLSNGHTCTMMKTYANMDT